MCYHISMIHILIAEDDKLFAQTLEDLLLEEGFAVTLCHDGAEAEALCYENSYDLLLLDINMPGLSGIELLRSVRNQSDTTPAIYLTSYKEKEMLCKGFDAGADDYLKKPVDPDELILRIRALLKRSNKSLATVKLGDIEYDKTKKVLITDNKTISLSPKVAQLLDLFIENPNRVVSREQIKKRLWEWDENPSDGALRVYVNELKKLIGKTRIENIKGIGYRFAF